MKWDGMSDREFDDASEWPSGIRGSSSRREKVIAPFVKLWFRAEVRGLESFPPVRRCNGGVQSLRRCIDALTSLSWRPAFYETVRI